MNNVMLHSCMNKELSINIFTGSLNDKPSQDFFYGNTYTHMISNFILLY